MERHTRQGQPSRAVAQVRGLDEYEPLDWPSRGRPKAGPQSVHPADTIACPGCWCGLPQGHDWPGRAEGSPHPREAPETWQDAARRLPGGRS